MQTQRSTTQPNSRRRKLARFGLSALRFVFVAYVALFIFLAVKQREFIFAGGRPHDPAAYRVQPGPGCRLVMQGSRTLGLFEPALMPDGKPYADSTNRPTLLYFYGNGSCVIGSVEDMEPVRKAGVNVFIPEYAGYGMNSGRPSERGCFATADAAYAYLTHDLHIDPRHLVIAGWSLGSAVAIDLASRVKAAGLVVISPFTNMADAASHQYPIYPAWLIRLVLQYPFANDRKIGRVAYPILDIHSKTDEVVPFSLSGRLLRNAKAPVARVVIERARHNEFFTVGGDRVRNQVLAFIARSTR